MRMVAGIFVCAGLSVAASCSSLSGEKSRTIELLSENADRVRVLAGAGESKRVVVDSRDGTYVRAWRVCLRIVPELDFVVREVRECGGEEVVIENVRNCNCSADYVVYFLKNEDILLRVYLLHVWDGIAKVRCEQINLGSDTPLLPGAAEDLVEMLGAVGEEKPKWDEGTQWDEGKGNG